MSRLYHFQNRKEITHAGCGFDGSNGFKIGSKISTTLIEIASTIEERFPVISKEGSADALRILTTLIEHLSENDVRLSHKYDEIVVLRRLCE